MCPTPLGRPSPQPQHNDYYDDNVYTSVARPSHGVGHVGQGVSVSCVYVSIAKPPRGVGYVGWATWGVSCTVGALAAGAHRRRCSAAAVGAMPRGRWGAARWPHVWPHPSCTPRTLLGGCTRHGGRSGRVGGRGQRRSAGLVGVLTAPRGLGAAATSTGIPPSPARGLRVTPLTQGAPRATCASPVCCAVRAVAPV